MNLQAPQNSLTTQLQADFLAAGTEFKALDMPENEEGYTLGAKVGAAFVLYFGSQSDPANTSRVVAQNRKAKFNIELHCRNLYGATGLRNMMDIMEQSLLGFAPTNCKRLYHIKDEITKIDTGVWVHAYQFECETMFVQKADDDPVIVTSFQNLNEPD